MQIIQYPTDYRIDVPYDGLFRKKIEAIKELPERHFDGKKKLWIVPISEAAHIENLCKRFNCGVEVYTKMAPERTGEIAPMPKLDIDIPLKKALYEYQRDGVAAGLQFEQYINGDDMGLGKTFESIATIAGLVAKGENPFPCLVICPAVAKINWQREWAMFTDYKALILSDKIKDTWPTYYDQGLAKIFIVNYESLKKYFVVTMGSKQGHSKEIVMRENIHLFKSVIVDEIHGCKDHLSQKCKLTLRLCFKKRWVIGLTGTPVQNKVKDLWPQLAIIGKLHIFGGKKEFLNRYCEGGNGANNLKELHYLLKKNCYFRREKKDVLKDLPEKSRRKVICEITTRHEYEQVRHNFQDWLKDKGYSAGQINKALRGEALTRMMALMQLSAKGKIAEVKDYIEEIVDAGQKVVIFCNLIDIVNQLKALFPLAVCVTGQQNDIQKQAAVDKFQNDPRCQIIIGNIKAASTAITLTAAYNVGFLEWPWNPALCNQAEDRCNRNGQKNAVMCTYFMGDNTIDERVYDLIMEKNQIANAITGATDEMDMQVVDKMLNIFNQM